MQHREISERIQSGMTFNVPLVQKRVSTRLRFGFKIELHSEDRHTSYPPLNISRCSLIEMHQVRRLSWLPCLIESYIIAWLMFNCEHPHGD